MFFEKISEGRGSKVEVADDVRISNIKLDWLAQIS